MKHIWNFIAVLLSLIVFWVVVMLVSGCTLIVQDSTTVIVTVKDSTVSPVVSPSIGK